MGIKVILTYHAPNNGPEDLTARKEAQKDEKAARAEHLTIKR